MTIPACCPHVWRDESGRLHEPPGAGRRRQEERDRHGRGANLKSKAPSKTTGEEGTGGLVPADRQRIKARRVRAMEGWKRLALGIKLKMMGEGGSACTHKSRALFFFPSLKSNERHQDRNPHKPRTAQRGHPRDDAIVFPAAAAAAAKGQASSRDGMLRDDLPVNAKKRGRDGEQVARKREAGKVPRLPYGVKPGVGKEREFLAILDMDNTLVPTQWLTRTRGVGTVGVGERVVMDSQLQQCETAAIRLIEKLVYEMDAEVIVATGARSGLRIVAYILYLLAYFPRDSAHSIEKPNANYNVYLNQGDAAAAYPWTVAMV
ncbi:unnamed protein product [Vitrella brassicaformis CCMP3155]|uniref:Uncharacterized protein n=1 Tax=Vitrella brassicaformis (strain CCMP3155) TaxID=1169540 RepID=A0A0G4FMG5_VITBC|nr:unnamed protein product [Vitrella brassicaformis CCMP3155]|eukprot:CEM14760.1 unnamed protein product [Vitrella brassicaformis CCMP3155]